MSLRVRRFLAPLAFALAALAASAADPSQVIYPGGSSTAGAARKPDAGFGAVTVVGALVLAGAGAWLLLVRGRKLPFPGRDARKLAIDETRSLGSRQYLVVASYEGRKMLLGVCPGRIELLTQLDGSPAPEKKAT